MAGLQAVLWDVDGTLAETERDGHRVAFNQAFEELGLPWRWDLARYGQLLGVTGGRERLLHDMDSQPDAPSAPAERAALAASLHTIKNRCYADAVRRASIPLREGVTELLAECRERGLRMGIVTTTGRANVDALLRAQLGTDWAGGFAVIVSGEDVRRKKPDPEAYLAALAALGLRGRDVLAIEDSPAGAAAARAAACPVVVTRSLYFREAPIECAVAIGPGLACRRGWQPPPRDVEGVGPVRLSDLEAWWRLAQA